MINKLYFLFILVLFFSFGCEENKRNLAGLNADYECVHDYHCDDNWVCVDNYCRRDCSFQNQDNDNDGICSPRCEYAETSCSESEGKEIDTCSDKSGKAIVTCKCKEDYQDNDNNGSCKLACKNDGTYYTCPENQEFDFCDDNSGFADVTCKCKEGYQDNNHNGVCNISCSETSCEENASCNDSTGLAICICNNDSIDINDGNGCVNRMVTIPRGNFFMGCNDDENAANYDSSCDDDEKSYHEVELDSYKIDIYEVTVADFKICVTLGNCSKGNFNATWNYAHDSRNYHPMNGVNYFGAKEYCESLGFRLPTEAEWEKAARGVDNSIYPWGNDNLSCDYATYGNGCGEATTSIVGSKALNVSSYGVYDMVGNVWEWSSDYYSESYTSEFVINPKGPETGTQIVVHGGGWNDDATSIRASNRYANTPDKKNIDTGFRCAQSIIE